MSLQQGIGNASCLEIGNASCLENERFSMIRRYALTHNLALQFLFVLTRLSNFMHSGAEDPHFHKTVQFLKTEKLTFLSSVPS